MNNAQLRKLRRDKIRKLLFGGCMLALFVLLLSILIGECNLRVYGQIVNGKVTGVHITVRDVRMDYAFFVDGKLYTGNTSYREFSSTYARSLIGESFPVLYYKRNPANNRMLMTRQAFKRYGEVPPDSLMLLRGR